MASTMLAVGGLLISPRAIAHAGTAASGVVGRSSAGGAVAGERAAGHRERVAVVNRAAEGGAADLRPGPADGLVEREVGRRNTERGNPQGQLRVNAAGLAIDSIRVLSDVDGAAVGVAADVLARAAGGLIVAEVRAGAALQGAGRRADRHRAGEQFDGSAVGIAAVAVTLVAVAPLSAGGLIAAELDVGQRGAFRWAEPPPRRRR